MSSFGGWFGRWFGGWFGPVERIVAVASPYHVRRQVRDAFAAQVAGLASTGANVFPSRLRNLSASEIPGLRIYTPDEVILDDDVLDTPYMQHRTIRVRVEALAKSAAGLADMLDGISREVEDAISANPTLSGLSPLYVFERHFDQVLDDGTDRPAGMATLDFDFVVLTMSDAPNVAL